MTEDSKACENQFSSDIVEDCHLSSTGDSSWALRDQEKGAIKPRPFVALGRKEVRNREGNPHSNDVEYHRLQDCIHSPQ